LEIWKTSGIGRWKPWGMRFLKPLAIAAEVFLNDPEQLKGECSWNLSFPRWKALAMIL
jgi:hypothetical protein